MRGRLVCLLSLIRLFLLAASCVAVSVSPLLGQRRAIEVRAEIFNLFNTPNFGAPNAVQGAANFGTITSAFDPRVAQLALKLIF